MAWTGLATAVATAGILIPHAPSFTKTASPASVQAAQSEGTAVFHQTAVHPVFHTTSTSTPRAAQSTPVPYATPLQQNWNALVQAPQLIHSRVSAYAYDLTAHRPLAAINPTVELIPGSVTKLFTSAAALSVMSPQFRYQTDVLASPAVLAGKPGPVYLVGHGDPWLEANGRHDLETLAQQVLAKVPHVTQVIGITNAYTGPVYGVGWPQGTLTQNYGAGSTALMAERSEVAVLVSGTSPGQKPLVTFKFNGTAQAPGLFQVINRASTSGSGSADTIQVVRKLGSNRLVVTGHLAPGTAIGPLPVSVHNGAQFAAGLLQSAMARDGASFKVAATVADTVPSNLQVVARHFSPPLSYELAMQNRYSINQLAENLFRAAGLAATGTGSVQAAQTVLSKMTNQAQIAPGRIQVDGSGLSPLDQMSSQQVVELLQYAATQPWFSTFQNSLIHLNSAKACGFLCGPFWHYALPANTAIWVKPGSLSNQWNLAGYVKAEDGHLIAFAILDDGTPTQANMVHGSPVDQMMSNIAFWPQVPGPKSGPPETVSGTMPKAVSQLLAGVPGLSSASNVAVSVTNAATGQILYQQNGNTLVRAGLAPRAILDMAALQHLPAAMPPVRVWEAGTIQNGVLQGNLTLQGSNANLSPSDLAALAAHVEAAGITTVSGEIRYVNGISGFNQNRWPGGMAWEAFGKGWAVPASPLWYNGDLASIGVSGGTPGSQAQVALSPADTPMVIENQTTTVKTGPSTLNFSQKLGSNTIILTGSVPVGSTQILPLAPSDPGLYAATEFVDALRTAGVRVSGQPESSAEAPTGRVVATLPGSSIASLALQSLTSSSLMAPNALLGQLGRDHGTILAATLSAPASVFDWTGGSLTNYLTTDGLAGALQRAYQNPKDAALVSLLQGQVWQSQSPEQYEALGYVPGPGNTVDAVAILISGLAWNGSFAPTVITP